MLVSLLVLAPSSQAAQPPGRSERLSPQLTLEIDIERDITFNGMNAYDVLGRDVVAGDVNGDGVDDLIVGARQGDPDGRQDAGETYVFFGPLESGTFEIPAVVDVLIKGIAPGDHTGISLAIGDINDDTRADLIIGARRANPGGRVDAGETYVMFGPLTSGVFELSSRADITVNGVDEGDESGVGAASGDLNNDGVDDLIIGARHADPNGTVDGGETYVVFGPLGAGTYELLALADVTIKGTDPEDRSGYGLDVADVSGDAVPDLIVGAWGADPNGKMDAGEVSILFGPLPSGVLELSSDSDVTIAGIDPEDHLGVGAALADVNQDGVADVLVGATQADPPDRPGAGEAYVIYGPLTSGSLELAASADVTFYGIDSEDFFGIGVESGDLNNDSAPDLIFGAFRADSSSKDNAGAVYVVFGVGCAGRAPTLVGTTGDDILVGTSANDAIMGLDGNDVIRGLGGHDVICGGAGHDTLVGGNGWDRLLGNSGHDDLFGGPGDDVLLGGSGDDVLRCDAGFDVALGGPDVDASAGDCELVFGIP